MPEIPDSASERLPRSANWGGKILSAFLGIVVTVAGALILGKLQAHDPHLLYTSTGSLPFSGPNGEVSIYQVTVSNEGKREVYDVACAIRIPSAKIDQYKVTADPLLNVVGMIEGDSINIQIPNLNPQEFVQVALLASGPQDLPSRPQVSLRGKGATGTEKTTANREPEFGTITLTAAAGLSALVVTALSTLLLKLKRSSKSQSSGGGDDQRQVLSYICRVQGLRDLADQYSAQTHETTYWAEADRLGEIATDGPPERMLAIEGVLLCLIKYARPARASRAIVYYNIALINRARNNGAAYDKFLNLAKETADDVIGRRLDVDRRFLTK